MLPARLLRTTRGRCKRASTDASFAMAKAGVRERRVRALLSSGAVVGGACTRTTGCPPKPSVCRGARPCGEHGMDEVRPGIVGRFRAAVWGALAETLGSRLGVATMRAGRSRRMLGP
jgi:hypothetical protein